MSDFDDLFGFKPNKPTQPKRRKDSSDALFAGIGDDHSEKYKQQEPFDIFSQGFGGQVQGT